MFTHAHLPSRTQSRDMQMEPVMLPVINSLIEDHDLRLVLLAAVICAFGALCTVNVSSRATSSGRSMLWLVLLSVCAGATVWATHFIAMLAYRQRVAATYD